MGINAERLAEMDDEQLRQIYKKVRTLGQRLRSDGPQTDDELHAWVKKNIGVDIPRVAVCTDRGHVAPFTFLADVYFERVGSALAMANRGGSKTFVVAILHYLNSTFKSGCESLSFGATEAQGNRCYSNIEDWCYVRDKETGRRTDNVHDFILGKPMKSETNWKTGAKVEVVAGTESAVSGPHPQKAHADEIELMDNGTWNQSRGMAVAKKATGPLPKFMEKFNGIIPPQDVATSTRNSKHGRMQEIIKEINEDLKAGNFPEFTLYTWCIWETVAEIPSCRCVAKELREARLAELGLPTDELCICNKVVKGRYHDGTTRTLETMCKGRAFRARGWKPVVDLVQTFKRNTPGTWTLQHECGEGQDENNYIEGWSLEFYGIRNYEPIPKYGKIYQGIDWGGTNAYSVLWFQYLKIDVPAWDFNYEPIWLSTNLYVCFDEIYVAGIDTAKLQLEVANREMSYKAKYPGWRVAGRFMDPQGKSDRTLFARKGMPGSWPIQTRDKATMISTVQNLVIDDRFAVDVDRCPMFCEEVEAWQKDPKTGKEVDNFNHAMAAWRYGISNAEVREGNRVAGADPEERKQLNDQPGQGRARTVTQPHKTGIRSDGRGRRGPVAYSGGDKHPVDQFDAALR